MAVERSPERLAIIDGDVEISFRELNEQVNQLGRYLKKVNREGRPVGLYIEKSYHYLIAGMAILKSGVGYIHIDSDYEDKIIDHVLKENEPHLVISLSLKRMNLPPGVGEILLDQDFAKWAGELKDNIQCSGSPQDVAIIGYTSGTTGMPKGVAVSHKACLYAFCKFWDEIKNISEKDRFGYLTYLAWDAMSPLLFNATGIIIRNDENMDNIVNSIEKYEINHVFFTPSLLNQILKYFSYEILAQKLSSLKIIWLGGEILNQGLVIKMATLFPEIKLLNNYGPTEFFVVAQGFLTIADTHFQEGIPAGHILPEVEFKLYDETGTECTANNVGFLSVSGPAIANGYIKNDHLNQDKFFTHLGRRFYKTGDFVKVLEDGRLIVLARQNFLYTVNGKMYVLKQVEEELKNEFNFDDCVAICRKTDRIIGEELHIYYIGHIDESSEKYDRVMGKYINLKFTRINAIPLHPVSSKINYGLLINESTEQGKNG